jgi:hypothetical protein
VPASVPFASHRVLASPSGKTIETDHYPFQVDRGFRMCYSLGGLVSPYDNVYQHNASEETESSGSGIFEAGVDGVAGVNVAETNISNLSSKRVPGQTVGPLGIAGPRPNKALMFTSANDANVSTWINTPL